MKIFPQISRVNLCLKGNTLMEVLMGLSILSLIFLIGMDSLGNIMGIRSPVQEFRTQLVLSDQLLNWEEAYLPFEGEIELNGRRIEKKISWIDDKKGLIKVELLCFWGEKKVGERKKIIQAKRK